MCIDLDHVIQDRKLSLMAKEIIGNFTETYMELSQSGEGIHILSKGLSRKISIYQAKELRCIKIIDI